jgi:hypothetical protein
MLGIAGNSAIILLNLLTRVVEIPLFGPEEDVGFVDVCATVSEATIVIAIGALLLRGTIKQSAALMAPILAGALMLIAHLPHLGCCTSGYSEPGSLLPSANTLYRTQQRFGLLENVLHVPL